MPPALKIKDVICTSRLEINGVEITLSLARRILQLKPKLPAYRRLNVFTEYFFLKLK
jgi:hypothetical protein